VLAAERHTEAAVAKGLLFNFFFLLAAERLLVEAAVAKGHKC
jgi:hypothetical protein